MSFFGFLVPALADAASAVLVVAAILSVAIEPRRACWRSLPVVIAVVWLGFVLASAVSSTWEGLPGPQFHGIEKQIPIALGPIAAIALTLACERVHWTRHRLVSTFLLGLVGGATLLLSGNGAVELFSQPASRELPNATLFGTINRNYAALACGLSLIATLGLISYGFETRASSRFRKPGVMAALISILAGTACVLVILQSRTGYLAAAAGLGSWAVAMAQSFFRNRATAAGRSFVLTGFIVLGIALTVCFAPVVKQRLDDAGSTRAYIGMLRQLAEGHPIDSADLQASDRERLQLVAAGVGLIKQRPWFGWGPNATNILETLPAYSQVKRHIQFHNGYLQLLVNFGVAGATMATALFVALIHAAFSLRRFDSPEGYRSSMLPATCISLVIYLLVSNAAESVLFVKPAAMSCLFIAAISCMRYGKTANA